MDYEAIYKFRFADVDHEAKLRVWKVIAADIARRAGRPRRVLDPACGSGEFIEGVPAAERWASDVMPPAIADPTVRVGEGGYESLDYPVGYFDAIVFSNVLEHLASPDHVQSFLVRARSQLVSGGRVVIMGPNFKYAAREYFDFADHTLVLTERSIVEHLVSAGFRPDVVIPRYLPYSFRSRLPAIPWLVSVYLRLPFAWRLFGRQFLVIGSAP